MPQRLCHWNHDPLSAESISKGGHSNVGATIRAEATKGSTCATAVQDMGGMDAARILEGGGHCADIVAQALGSFSYIDHGEGTSGWSTFRFGQALRVS